MGPPTVVGPIKHEVLFEDMYLNHIRNQMATQVFFGKRQFCVRTYIINTMTILDKLRFIESEALPNKSVQIEALSTSLKFTLRKDCA